jgi:hypothetical protein
LGCKTKKKCRQHTVQTSSGVNFSVADFAAERGKKEESLVRTHLDQEEKAVWY